MRMKNSIYNVISSLLIIITQTILVFCVRIFFVKYLNAEYLGIQGLFNNIISMLSLADLGIATSICFSLYEPLAKKNYKKISSIVSFFRKIYWSLSVAILFIGLAMMPFIDNLANDYTMGNIKLIFLIYILMLAAEYLSSYKEVLILADQKKYKLTKINITFTFLIYIGQIVMLILFKNFIYYILSEFILKTIQFILNNLAIKKYYPEIDFFSKEKVDKKTKAELKKNVKGMFLFRIGDYLVNGTDNIIISRCINIVTVGIYGNYLSIISILKNINNNIINGITSSFGNLIVEEDEKTQENVFNIMDYINFVIVGYFFVCILQLFNRFINLCFGTNYLLGTTDMILVCINFYLISILLPINSVKSAAGLYYEDRYVPIIQAVINLLLSIILAKYIGLTGVLLGTTISYLFIVSWQRPYIVYKKVFNSSYSKYLLKHIIRIFVIVLVVILNYIVFNFLTLPETLFGFIGTGMICTILYTIILLIYSYRKKEFNYIIEFIKVHQKKIMKNKKSV